MSFLLDVDTCISCIRGSRPTSDQFALHTGSIYVSVVAVTELGMWVLRPTTPSRHMQSFFSLLQAVKQIEVDETIAYRAARVGNSLRNQGKRPGMGDILVAATALERGLTLVTHSLNTYAPIAGLTVVDWAIP